MNKAPILTGLLLILLGSSLFFLQDAVETRILVFLLLGAAFIGIAVVERAYGFLVPGGIMMGLGFGLLAEDWVWMPIAHPAPFGLGLGFLLIYVIDRVLTNEGGWWPLVPGGVMVLAGIGLDREVVRWVFREGWPLALVAVGLYLVGRELLGGGSRSSGGDNGSQTEFVADAEIIDAEDEQASS